MNSRDLSALLLLSALWGASFLFIRVAVPALGPLLLIELRVLVAGLVLLGYGLLTRSLPRWRPWWPVFLSIGVLNSALPFTLIAFAELHLTASLAAVLNATTPLFGAVVAALWLGEALTPLRVMGLLLGLLGVGVLVGVGPLPLSVAVLLSCGASLLAALLYGVAAVYTRQRAQGVPPLAIATYSQLCAALVLLPAIPLAWPAQAPPLSALLSTLALGVLCTALAYLLYFRLIASIGAVRAVMVTYLTPVFGMLWGTLFLGEVLGWGSLLGLAMIASSVLLAGRKTPPRPVPAVSRHPQP